MNKEKKKLVTTIVVMVMIATIILAGYFRLSTNSKRSGEDSTTAMTEEEKLLSKDILSNYPGTPREVLKLYSRIIKCFYEDELKEKNISKLAEQIHILFDAELLEKNPKEEYLEQLKGEIAEYQAAEKTIISYTIQKTSGIKYETVDKVEYATLIAEYLVKEKTKYSKSYEEFILRQDAEGNWKILGWKITEKGKVEEE